MLQEENSPKFSKAFMLNTFRKKKFIENEKDDDEDLIQQLPSQNSPIFKKFYCDILPEFEKFGKIENIFISNNFSPHLRGNVYITYKSLSDSIECFNKMNGRFYAGLPLNVSYSFIHSIKDAKCIYQHKCPRIFECNFLHVYTNPNIHNRKRSRSPRKNFK